MPTTPRAKVLQVSYACDPCASMESRLSWHRAVESAKEFDTWVICQPLKRDALGRELPERPVVEGLTICEVSSPLSWMKNYGPLFYTAYHAFQKQAFKKAAELHEEIRFDLTHQVSFCGFREPGYLWQLDAPFVWGPIGGTQSFPTRYFTQLSPRGFMSELARNCLNRFHLQIRRRVHNAAKNAAHVFAANSTAKRDFLKFHSTHCELQLETGIETLPDWQLRSRSAKEPLRILWSGRLCHWKGLVLLLKAVAAIGNEVPIEVRVMGFGPEKQSSQRLAQKLGIENSVEFLEWPVYEDQLKQYEWADVFAFTSLRDTSGTGLLEAIAHGCPLIAVDHQGAADIVTKDSGIRIPVKNPHTTIVAFNSAIIELANSPEKLAELSHGARQRASHYLWEKLGARMREVYRDVIGIAADKASTEKIVNASFKSSTPPPASDANSLSNRMRC